MRYADNLTYVKCGKCGEVKGIVCLVDDIPYCEDCLNRAMGIEKEEEWCTVRIAAIPKTTRMGSGEQT